MLDVSRLTAQTQTSGQRTSGSINKLRATGLLPILVHSSGDANSTALLGNMRISGTVFLDLQRTRSVTSREDLFIVTFFFSKQLFIRVQISMGSPKKLMFFSDIF